MIFGEWRRWLNNLFRNARGRAAGRKRARPARPGLEVLEGREVPAVGLSVVNDNWAFVADNDHNSMLSVGDTIRNDNDTINTGALTRVYGVDGFGTVTTGQFTGSVAGAATINDAIANTVSGGTVEVLEGTYAQRVNVNKSLTVLGAQHGVDARTRSGAESVVTGVGNTGQTPFYVTANNVTLDGFTVEGATSGNQFGYGVLLGQGTSGAQVLNNIIQDNIIGLGLANNAAGEAALIQHNLFRNNNATGPAGGNAIYTDQYVASPTLANVTIDANTFINNRSVAVNLGSVSQSNITISNNEMTGNGQAVRLVNTTAASIFRNTITGSTGGSQVVIGGSVNDLSISENFIQNGRYRGIQIAKFAGLGTNQNVTISNNSLTGNGLAGLEIYPAGYTGALDANSNWWGTSTGPTVASTGGTGANIVDPSGQVDYSPWLTTGTDTDLLTTGFQGFVNHAPVASDDSFTLEEDGSPIYSQDFQSSADGWFNNGGTITLSNGHAIFTGSGPFTRFDGYSSIFPQGGFITAIRVYLDTNWAPGAGFDYSVAVSGQNGLHLRDFIFHVSQDLSTGGLLVGGSNNSGTDPRQDLENLNHYEVTASGWYTLQHDFHERDGVLEVDLNLLDADGNVLFTETRSSASDRIADVVGGNRYGWFTNIDIDSGVKVGGSSLVRSPTRGNVLANDSDPVDGNALSAQLVQGPQHAYSFTLKADGSFTYVPMPNYHGADTFTYRVIDNGGTGNGGLDTSNVATVTLTINAVNDAPVAGNDSVNTPEQTPVTIDVLANDSDVEGSALTPSIVTGPAYGTVVVNADGTFTYTPVFGFTGTDTFTYKVSDDSLDSTVATVTITVDPLPAGVSISSSGELIVSGSDAADRIVISRVGTNRLRVTSLIDGQFESRVYSRTGGFTAIRINVHGGDDRVTIDPTLGLPVHVVGGDGNDTITTGAGKDFVYGDAVDGSGDGNDTIVTGAGDDFVNAGNGTNYVSVGAGNDTVNAGNGVDRVRAGNGNNDIRVGDGDNNVRVGVGRNTIVAGDGSNVIQAGNGRNTITAGNGGNYITTGSSADVIRAGNGPNWVSSGAGNDDIHLGDGGNDVLAGDGSDVVITGAGSDSINGGTGADLILSGAGNDVVQGGQGNDVLVGGQGEDYLAGEDGRDVLFAGAVGLLPPVSGSAAPLDLLNQLRLLQLAWNPARGPLPKAPPSLSSFGLVQLAEHLPTFDMLVGGAQNDLLWSDNGELDSSIQ